MLRRMLRGLDKLLGTNATNAAFKQGDTVGNINVPSRPCPVLQQNFPGKINKPRHREQRGGP